jgi:hypothetical protein
MAPLPTALLSAERPARDFIGHVEPTFDWTLERTETGRLISAATIRAPWTGCLQRRPEPIGLAFRQRFTDAAELFGESAQTNRNSRPDSPEGRRATLQGCVRAAETIRQDRRRGAPSRDQLGSHRPQYARRPACHPRLPAAGPMGTGTPANRGAGRRAKPRTRKSGTKPANERQRGRLMKPGLELTTGPNGAAQGRGRLLGDQNGWNSSNAGSNDGSGSRRALQRGTASAAGSRPMVEKVPSAKAAGIPVQPRVCS